MNRRGLSLLEMTIAIGITAIIGVAIAAMMAAASNSLSSKDDGRQSAIRLATTQVRLAAYIAPSRCILEKTSTQLTLWLDDSKESNTVHSSEIRWIQFDESTNTLTVKFVDFPSQWTQSMIDTADIECNGMTDYNILLETFSSGELIETITLVDSIHACNFWVNTTNPIDATQISVRFSLKSTFGQTKDSIIDETIRLHRAPLEQQ